MVCWCVYWKTGLQFKIRVKKKKDYKPTHYVPAYHLAHTLVCNEDQFSEALVLFTLGMQICQLDIDSLTVNMISPVQYLMTLLSLSLIARMIEKYACFKCWYLKYQSIGIKYMCFHIYLFQYLWRNYRCFINGNNMNLPCPLTFYVLQKSYHCTWIMFYGNYMKMLII